MRQIEDAHRRVRANAVLGPMQTTLFGHLLGEYDIASRSHQSGILLDQRIRLVRQLCAIG